MDFSDKKIYIAPHTPKTVAFQKELCKEQKIEFLGFIDKEKTGKDITKIKNINQAFDFILILSQNHFDAIYQEYIHFICKKKIIKVSIVDGRYTYLTQKHIAKEYYKNIISSLKLTFFKNFVKLIDLISLKRNKTVFVSKGFVSTNNKALFCECIRQNVDVYLLTDNAKHLKEMHTHTLPALQLGTFRSFWHLAFARFVILDQGNFLYELNLLSPKQKTIQLWHGIPLKRMNKLVGYTYDYLISTSNFVNETSLSQVISAKEYKNYGYPRNDLLLKNELDLFDELFCDHKIFQQVQNNTSHKVIVYMPTHRENTHKGNIPLDFIALNEDFQKLKIYFIVKLHPFVKKLYSKTEYQNLCNIFFYESESDIYPLLRYCDILVTDYSSIYFDFMLLEKPIIFFDYDKEEYESHHDGFSYGYEEFTPGIHCKNQEELLKALEANVYFDTSTLGYKLNDFIDSCSSKRILSALLSESNG